MRQIVIPTKNVPHARHPPPLCFFADPGGVLAKYGLHAHPPTVISAAMAKKSQVNKAGNYTKPEMRKSLYQQIKAQATHGTKAGQWSARKAQLLAKKYKEKGGGYRD